MSFPTIDVTGVKRRSPLRPKYFDEVETDAPGYVAQQVASWTSSVYARLRKRYGNSLPFGQAPPPVTPAGLNPPALALSGRPTLGSLQVVVQVTTGGPIGTAVFTWSADGGYTKTTGILVAAQVPLGATGLVALFTPGTYDPSNVYTAPTPVPETILRWIATLVSYDVLFRHGYPRPGDPIGDRLADDVRVVRAEIEEAANQKDGLFELPTNDDSASAISTQGPLGSSDASPYAWTDRQFICGVRQDGGRRE